MPPLLPEKKEPFSDPLCDRLVESHALGYLLQQLDAQFVLAPSLSQLAVLPPATPYERNTYLCTSSGPVKSWEPQERLTVMSVRELFTRFLDITTPPTTILLQYLATTCENEDELVNMAMAEKKNEYGAGVEADRKLLVFDTWEDYLDSLIEIADLRNLRSIISARTIAALGYRSYGDTLLEKEFYVRRSVINEIVYPKGKPYVLVSEGADLQDSFTRELAVRERANRVGILQSIIFIRHFTKGGFEISGYIDYAHRLLSENWSPFFKYGKTLWPRDNDLGYYHWRHGTVRSNISRNYKPVMDPDRGLLFQNRHDHKLICPDPQQDPGQNTTKQRIYSPKYTQIEIYDHVVRRRS